MECHVCMESFDDATRRPKVLPCGHTFCLQCLRGLKGRCPLDNKVFQSTPANLADNFMVLQLSTTRPAEAGGARFWCRTCSKVAAGRCVDRHDLCNLKVVRAADAEPLLEALQRGEAGLGRLAEALDAAAQRLDVQGCRARLQKEKSDLAAARGRLWDAEVAEANVWEAAKQAAVQSGLSRSAAQLADDLADPSATCSLTVWRGATGDMAWRGDVRPAEDPAARLLLCRLACRGVLLQHDQAPAEQRPAAPRWKELPNEGDSDLTVEEMASRMEVGSRVARGRDWEPDWISDGAPPGPGTVIEKYGGTVDVVWDRTGEVLPYYMGEGGKYDIRLLAAPLKPCLETNGEVLDVTSTSSDAGIADVFKSSDLSKVRSLVGLDCGASPTGSQFLLERLSPHLEGLQMAYPKQQHLDVAMAMPRLRALGLTGVTGELLQQVGQMASLRRLELHCTLDAPVPVLAFPATGLRWLRCGLYPLAAALALVRANADSLEELQLVAASEQPYGCPDLAAELRRCGLTKLRRMVLLRETAFGAFCRHDKASCEKQMIALCHMVLDCGRFATMACSECNRKLSFVDCPTSSDDDHRDKEDDLSG